MVRQTTLLALFAATATFALPSTGLADPSPCTPASRSELPSRPSPLRRFLGAAVPTLYLRLGRRTSWSAEATNPPTSRTIPSHFETGQESEAVGYWEVGVVWRPLEFIEFTDLPARRTTDRPLESLRRRCRRLLRRDRATNDSDGSPFDRRLERIILKRTLEAADQP